MTSPTPADSTSTQEGAASGRAEDAATGVQGGSADRMDPVPGGGGVAGAGADGQTAAREQLRKDLGERPEDAVAQDGSGP